MKKMRILALLCAFAMVLSLMAGCGKKEPAATTPSTERACTHNFVDGVCKICQEVSPDYWECARCGKPVQWTAWDGIQALKEGHYYLAGDVTMKREMLVSDIEVCLDMAGFDLKTASGYRGFTVNSKAVFTIMDNTNSGNSEIISASGVLDCTGGIFDCKGDGTVLTLRNITVRDGQVKGADHHGGNIYVEGATLNLVGTKVKDGKVHYIYGQGFGSDGGNVAGYSAVINIYEGTEISGGDVSQNDNSYGGNVYINGQGAQLNIYGGTITGGTALKGGNIYGNNAETPNDDTTIRFFGGTVTDGTAEEGKDFAFTGKAGERVTNVYIYGGTLGDIKPLGPDSTVAIYNGTFHVDPAKAGYNGNSLVGQCATSSGDGTTWTVTHTQGEKPCAVCQNQTNGENITYPTK